MRKSNQKGFTLVELIIVIAIIGVLAAILIPTMMNYVKKSRLRTANSNAKLAYTTVNAQVSDLMADGKKVADYDEAGEEVATYSSAGSTDEIKKAIYEGLKDNESKAGHIAGSFHPYDNSHANWMQWSASGVADDITGQWPNPASSVEKAESLQFGSYDAAAAN